MKKPESKTTAKSKAKPEPTETVVPKEPGKKMAATTPVVGSRPVEPGSATKAAAAGGQVKAAESALLGEDKAPAAAAKKPQSVPTPLTSPQHDRLASVENETSSVPSAGISKDAHKPAEVNSSDPQPMSRPAAESPDAKVAPVVTQNVQKTGFWPVALGGVVAAGLGAAAAIWALPSSPALDTAALRQEILAEVQAGNEALRDETVAAARAEMSTQLEEVSQQAGEAGAEAARQIIAEMPSGADTTPELQAALEAQSQQIVALTEKLAVLEAGGVPGADAGAGSAEMQQQLAAMQEQIQKTATDAQAQLDAVLAEAEALKQAAENSTQRAEAVAAIAALQTALDEGASTQPALQQLQDAGVAAPEVIQAEVPTLIQLQDGFAPAARSALRVALRDSSADADGGTLIGNFLRAQTGARSVQPREGADPDAVLSRAGAAVDGGDVALALSELEGLPAVAREAADMADWLASAQIYLEARAALNELSGQSN